MAQEALIPVHLIKQEPEEFCQLVCTGCLQQHNIDVYSSYNTRPYRCSGCENEEDDGPREKEHWEESGSMESHCNGADDIFYSDENEDAGSEEEEQKEGSVGMEIPCIGSPPSTSYITVTTHIVTEVYTLYYYKQ